MHNLNRKVCQRLPSGAGLNGSTTGGAGGSVGMGRIGQNKVRAYRNQKTSHQFRGGYNNRVNVQAAGLRGIKVKPNWY